MQKEAKSWINIFKNIIQEDKSCQFVQSEYEDRIFGVEKLSTQLMQLKNELEKDICDKFGIAKDGIYSTLMYNWLRANSCNIGSGGAWHRDSNRAQYKSIIYLSDVLDENGPFEYINERAHLKWIRVIKNGFGLRYNDNPALLEKKLLVPQVQHFTLIPQSFTVAVQFLRVNVTHLHYIFTLVIKQRHN